MRKFRIAGFNALAAAILLFLFWGSVLALSAGEEEKEHPVYGKPLDVIADSQGNISSTYKNPKGGYTILTTDRYGKAVSEHTFGLPGAPVPVKPLEPQKPVASATPARRTPKVITPMKPEEAKKETQEEDF